MFDYRFYMPQLIYWSQIVKLIDHVLFFGHKSQISLDTIYLSVTNYQINRSCIISRSQITNFIGQKLLNKVIIT